MVKHCRGKYLSLSMATKAETIKIPFLNLDYQSTHVLEIDE